MANSVKKKKAWKRFLPRADILHSKRNDRNETQNSDLIYAIGDIHGRHDLMVELIEKIRLDTIKTVSSSNIPLKIYMVFLGDYIDRGLQSKEVLGSLCECTFDNTELIFLKGNHEQVALEFLNKKQPRSRWFKFGGRETLASYGIIVEGEQFEPLYLKQLKDDFSNVLPVKHLNFMKALKSYWIHDKYMFVHAGIGADQPIEEQSDDEFLWIREGFLDSTKELPYIVVHGHTPEKNPVWDGRRIGVDTGAYISNQLTAVRVFGDSIRFIST